MFLFLSILQKFFLDVKNSKRVHCEVEIVAWDVGIRDVPEWTGMFLAETFTVMTSKRYLLFNFSGFDSNQIVFVIWFFSIIHITSFPDTSK